jgi:hypothetical protein
MSLFLTVLLIASENVEYLCRRTEWRKSVSEEFVKEMADIREYKMALSECEMNSK